MLLRCAVLLLYLNVARTSEASTVLSKDFASDVDARYSLWPSIHNGVRLMTIRKREAVLPPATTPKPNPQMGAESNTKANQGAQSNHSAAQPSTQNGGSTSVQASAQSSVQSGDHLPANTTSQQPPQPQQPATSIQSPPNNIKKDNKGQEEPPVLDNRTVYKPDHPTTNDTSISHVDNKTIVHNTTSPEPPKINLSDPGVVKRAFIVFGGFALLATAYYFIIYRKKANNSDAKNTHSSIDPNQFRYGVLQSEDKRSNMELSRVPLTMESDEDDDEDLEIFDLGQKKKSLSYINLEQHDEDIVLNDSQSVDMENLLVDIEDKNSDQLINWSSSGSKSIL